MVVFGLLIGKAAAAFVPSVVPLVTLSVNEESTVDWILRSAQNDSICTIGLLPLIPKPPNLSPLNFKVRLRGV